MSRTDAAAFFDLDGTLTDPKPGITACIRHALAGLGRAAPPADELLWCIGPPLPKTFYEKSDLYPVPKGANYKKNNHASAWHLDLDVARRAAEVRSAHYDRKSRPIYGWEPAMIGDVPYVIDVTKGSDADKKGLAPGDRVGIWSPQLTIGHHSNGQDGCLFETDVLDGDECVGVPDLSRINRKDGSFSTNFVRLGGRYRREWLTTINAGRVDEEHLGTSNLTLGIDIDLHVKTDDRIEPFYGQRRVRGMVGYARQHRCVLRYTLGGEGSTAEGSPETSLYGKVFSDGRGALRAAAIRGFRSA